MDPSYQQYVDLAYMAEKLGLPIETVRFYHKRSTRARREGRRATIRRMPAPDAPPSVSVRGHPRWLKETADEYISAKKRTRQPIPAESLHDKRARAGRIGMAKRWGNRNKDNHGTSGGVELTDEVVEQLAAEAERGYDPSKLSGPVMVRLSKAEKKLATEVLGSEFWNAINHGPPGWSAAMAPDRADDVSGALFDAWREHDHPVYELAVRFADEEARVPATRTKRGGWRPIRR